MIVTYRMTRADLKREDRSKLTKEKSNVSTAADPDLLIRVLLKMKAM